MTRSTNSAWQADYGLEKTHESYLEIQRLARWARLRGPTYYLIGGWAAWYYHRGLGSRDIDVVFPNRSIMDAFLAEYYREHGYSPTGGPLVRTVRKTVRVGKRQIHVEIDAAQIDQSPPFKEDERLGLPFTLLSTHSTPVQFLGEEVLIPRPELLILQKVKAYRDRNWTLAHEAVSPLESSYLQGKIAKDAYDIREIGARVDDWSTVATLAEDHHCQALVLDTLTKLRLKSSLT